MIKDRTIKELCNIRDKKSGPQEPSTYWPAPIVAKAHTAGINAGVVTGTAHSIKQWYGTSATFTTTYNTV